MTYLSGGAVVIYSGQDMQNNSLTDLWLLRIDSKNKNIQSNLIQNTD